MQLATPHSRYITSYVDALREGDFTHMALGSFGNATPEAVALDPEAHIAALTSTAPRPVTTQNGDTYILNDHQILWAVDGDTFIGGISMRYDQPHPLLDDYCGHAGLCVRKSLRGKGYGNQMWRLMLQPFRDRAYKTIRIRASPTNAASLACIKRLGGTLISTADTTGWGPVEVYEIAL